MGGGFEKMVQMFPSRIVLQCSQQGGDRHDDRQTPVGDGGMKEKKIFPAQNFPSHRLL